MLLWPAAAPAGAIMDISIAKVRARSNISFAELVGHYLASGKLTERELRLAEREQLAIGERVRRQVRRYVSPAIVGTLVGSAAKNAFAFASQTTTVYNAPPRR